MADIEKDTSFVHIDAKTGTKLDVDEVIADPRSTEPMTFEQFAYEIAILGFRARNAKLCPGCATQLEMAVPGAIMAHEQMLMLRRMATEVEVLSSKIESDGETKH